MPQLQKRPRSLKERPRLIGLFPVAAALDCSPSALRQCLVLCPRRSISGAVTWSLRKGGPTIAALEALAASSHDVAGLAAHLLSIRRESERHAA